MKGGEGVTLNARAPRLGTRAATDFLNDHDPRNSLSPSAWQGLPPIERQDPIPHDKIIMWPSARRPRQRDLERLVAR